VQLDWLFVVGGFIFLLVGCAFPLDSWMFQVVVRKNCEWIKFLDFRYDFNTLPRLL
jgi:hypothetical protein